MTKAEFFEVFQKWNTNPDFRHSFNEDPVEALRLLGIPLSMEEEHALRSASWNSATSAQEMEEIVSKAIGLKLSAFL